MSNQEREKQMSRVIRVFISSTFRDMQTEREELVKYVFPQLRKLCESRGVVWGEVDLRWGVTDEERAEGKVLPICLAEIQRCRPYFIGLLGERYGWVPREVPQELIEQEPWLKEHLNHSVTELEILHGVLRNPQMADHAFFYFRNPEYFQHLPPDADSVDYVSENNDARTKLVKLKESIRRSGLPVRENYPDPRTLGQLVLQDLTKVINDLYPEGSYPSPLDRDAADHEAFAKSLSRFFIGRVEDFKRLDEYAEGSGLPGLAILGEPGSGKSAFLATWSARYAASHPDTLMITHFIGASDHSSEWRSIRLRVLGEIKRKYGVKWDQRSGFPWEVSERAIELNLFLTWLDMAALEGTFVLIIDAVDHLEGHDAIQDLLRLRMGMDMKVRLIISASASGKVSSLIRPGWDELRLRLFDADEKKHFIHDYLGHYCKSLTPAQLIRVSSPEQTSSPLFLKALLDELRFFGSHEGLDERIDHYLEAKTVSELYKKILARYELDYDRDRPSLVRDTMSVIWAARRGLTEADLLNILGRNKDPLPSAYWSPFYIAGENMFFNRSGLLGFSQDDVRLAVESYFVNTLQSQKEAHLRVANYFLMQENTPRKIDELLWQLDQAMAWNQLVAVLTDSDLLLMAYKTNEFDVKNCWVRIETYSPYKMIEEYERAFSGDRMVESQVISVIVMLMWYSGYSENALKVCRQQIEKYRNLADSTGLQALLGIQAKITEEQGELGQAMDLLTEREIICHKIGDQAGLASSIGAQAMIHRARGELDRACALVNKQVQICRTIGDKAGLQQSLGNKALIYRSDGVIDHPEWDDEHEPIRHLLDEQERICDELGDRTAMIKALGIRAFLLKDLGDLDWALRILRRQERISRELGDKMSLQASLGNQATIKKGLGKLDEAIHLLKEQEQICRQSRNMTCLVSSLTNQAEIFSLDTATRQTALALAEEADKIVTERGLVVLADEVKLVLEKVRMKVR